MSDFKVEVVRIDNVEDHPNADRLTVVTIGGYKCISNKLEDGKWRYNSGDLVVYIPENALLPDWLLIRMGFWNDEKQAGTLSGSKGNRVKPIRLRGIFSEGVLYPVDIDINNQTYINVEGVNGWLGNINVSEGDDVSDFLGITKYEQPIPVHMRGKLKGGLLGYTVAYDIENFKKYPNVFEIGEDIVVTEKAHGTFMQVGIVKNPPENVRADMLHIKDDIYVYATSKGLAKHGQYQAFAEDNMHNLYVKSYMDYIHDRVPDIIKRYEALNDVKDVDWSLYIMGEVFGKGVQDMDYGQNVPTFRLFDVYTKQRHPKDGSTIKEGFLDFKHLTNWANTFNIELVPVLYQGPFINMQHLEQFRDGKTLIGDGVHIREGVVIKTAKENKEYYRLHMGRKQVKFVSPDYLLRKNGSEYQ